MQKRDFIYTLFSSFLLISLFLTGCGGRVNDVFTPAPGGSNVLVRVIDKMQTRPVPQARVSLKKDNQAVAQELMTNENGEVVFQNVPAGDGYIAFVNNATGYKSAASPVIKVSGNTESNVLLDRLGNGEGSGLIAGSVKDKTSKEPISRLSITYASQNNRAINRPIFTDEEGRFVIDGLVAGNYILTFSKLDSGYGRIQKTLSVQEGVINSIETIFMSRQGTASSGNFLVSLSGARKVVELNRNGQVLWSYNQLKSIESSVRLSSGNTVVTDSNSSRVVQVSKAGGIVSSFGGGTFFKDLKYPSWVDSSDGNFMLVTDNGSNQVIEFVNGNKVWSYSNGLNRPRSSVYLNNGNILIADTGNHRVIEVNKQGHIIWSYNENMDKPVHAVRLANGNTLITDAGYSRVLEVSPRNQVMWWFAGQVSSSAGYNNGTYDTGYQQPDYPEQPVDDGADIPEIAYNRQYAQSANAYSNQAQARYNQNPNNRYRVQNYSAYGDESPPAAPGTNLLFPRSAVRLSNGNTLIADTGNNRIIEVSKAKSIVWELPNLPRPVSAEQL